MNNNDSTAIPYYFYNRESKIWWIWKLEGVCTCYTAQITTAGTLFCPCHGLMRKSNGVVMPMNQGGQGIKNRGSIGGMSET